MAGSNGDFLSTIVKKIPFLNKYQINSEILLGVLMHLFLFLCIMFLLYLLARQFM
jgi:hypothetical protein